ncbi:hypothetical protein ACEYYA_02475 [Paracoccus sp. p3-h83]|uniref:hypothetical protein n=1 Tax=Paracoccus sp. p3-h83 TaxID=3342805 RepID=UPI0035B8C76E
MGYILRDRSDGQVEIVLSRPVLVGVFPDRDVADRVCAFLRAEEPALPDDEPAMFARAAADVADAVAEDLDQLANEVAPAPRRSSRRTQLPALAPVKPQAPAQTPPAPHNLSEAQIDQAFARLQQGEKVHAVAADYGLPMGQLRGMWANHKRQLQRYMADAGQQPCRLCARPFTPSIMNPETCARCSQ